MTKARHIFCDLEQNLSKAICHRLYFITARTAPIKLWPEHHWQESKPRPVVGPVFRVTDQSIAKCHQFENCAFYKFFVRQTN